MGEEERVEREEEEERELSPDTPWHPEEVGEDETGEVIDESDSPEDEGSYFSLYSLRNVKLKFHVELGRTTISVRELLGLQPGSVIELDRSTGEALDLYLNNNLFGKCEVLLIEESFSVRITSIVDPDE